MAFSLAQLQANQVVFAHEISHEGATVTLRVTSVDDGNPGGVLTVDENDAAGQVELTVTPSNDRPEATGTNTIPLNVFKEGETMLLSTALMGSKDYDTGDVDDNLQYVITDLDGLTVDGRIQAVIEHKFGPNDDDWRIVEIGHADASFSQSEIGSYRIRHLGEHQVNAKGTLSFDYTIDDDQAGDADNTPPVSKTVSVGVTPVNDRPLGITNDRNSIRLPDAETNPGTFGALVVKFSISDEILQAVADQTAYENLIAANDAGYAAARGRVPAGTAGTKRPG